jgi:hypothetical protein
MQFDRDAMTFSDQNGTLTFRCRFDRLGLSVSFSSQAIYLELQIPPPLIACQ